jgi:hypothetical protein
MCVSCQFSSNRKQRPRKFFEKVPRPFWIVLYSTLTVPAPCRARKQIYCCTEEPECVVLLEEVA